MSKNLKHDNKILHFLSAIRDCYRPSEERGNDLHELELSDEEITDDMYAITQAFFTFYRTVTGDTEMDMLGFTYMLNRLVFQFTELDNENEK